jgi:FkbM family methyltransferase
MSFKAIVKYLTLKMLEKTNLYNYVEGVVLMRSEKKKHSNLEKFADTKNSIVKQIENGLRYGKTDFYLHQFFDDNFLYLKNNQLRFIEKNAIDVLVHEILINEDYYFDAGTDAPVILDCGTNFGLSIYYFKHLYPNSTIKAFEPDPKIIKILQENIDKNGWTNVEVQPYALSDRDEVTRFYTTEIDSMAGSLTERRKVHGDKVDYIDVTCKTLSSYLTEKVDYVKMDIEGSEDKVLEECKHLLGNVHYLFCEYHHGNGLAKDRLVKILQILDDAGFDYQISKSYSYGKYTSVKPMNYIGKPYSSIIWAKNSNWNL